MAGMIVAKLLLSLFIFAGVNSLSLQRKELTSNRQEFVNSHPLSRQEPDSEYDAFVALSQMEQELDPIWRDFISKEFQYNVDSSEENRNATEAAQAAYTAAYARNWQYVIDYYNFETFETYFIRRQFELQEKPGTSVLSSNDFNTMIMSSVNMTLKSRSLLCPFDSQTCTDDSEKYSFNDLEVVLASERRVDALEYYWKNWRDMAGKTTKVDFMEFIKMVNRAAVAAKNGYTDGTGLWMADYVDFGYSEQDYQSDVEGLWNQVKGLYYKLHAYVRYRLRNSAEYQNTFNETSPIPANILGDMHAENWKNIYDLVAPYSDLELLDISDALHQNITDVIEMFKLAEDFYTSIGFFNMTDKFYELSLFSEQANGQANCNPAAWDMFSENNPQIDGDFRAEMCTDKNQEDFMTIHQIMGRIEYYMSYSIQNGTNNENARVMRFAANPAIFLAVGDAIGLSVSTQTRLEKLYQTITGVAAPGGSLTDDQIQKRNINQLMKTALKKIPVIPYAYILDKFRGDIFAESINEEEFNYYWWKYRVEVQGVKPPTLRSKSNDFDAGSKYDVQLGLSYIRHFFGNILQFQFHDKMCESSATETYLCDVYGNKEAGEKLRDSVLINGRLYPWVEQLSYYFDTDLYKMDAQALLDYFKPLDDFLTAEIASLSIPTDLDTAIDVYFSD